MAEERVAPELAVGHHVEPGVLLHPDRLVHRRVLDPLELRRGQAAGLGVPAGLDEGGGPEQAAHHVGADRGSHHFILLGSQSTICGKTMMSTVVRTRAIMRMLVPL